MASGDSLRMLPPTGSIASRVNVYPPYPLALSITRWVFGIHLSVSVMTETLISLLFLEIYSQQIVFELYSIGLNQESSGF